MSLPGSLASSCSGGSGTQAQLLVVLEEGGQGGTEGDVCVFRKPWSVL